MKPGRALPSFITLVVQVMAENVKVIATNRKRITLSCRGDYEAVCSDWDRTKPARAAPICEMFGPSCLREL
jgi:hypothetical protein